MSELREKEAGIEKSLQEGDTESAVQGLYDLIVAYAQQKDFAKAEALRDRLYEVDPMALSEIVKSGEIIEQEMADSLDEGHMETFSDLYAALSKEETNALYYALSPAQFDTDQAIFREGEPNSRLFLLDRGEVKVTHGEGEREVLLKTLEPGEMIGGETFFARTAFCTHSAVTLTQTNAMVLEHSSLEGWKEDFPGLEEKIVERCFRGGDIQDLLKRQAVDRRKQERFKLSGSLMLQLLGKDQKPVGKPFKGGFSDISEGGLSFTVRISKSDTARLLLGRRLNMTCRLTLKEGTSDLRTRGRIIAVQPLPFNEYSVHVRFEKALPADLLKELDLSASATSPDLDLKIEEQ